MTNRPTRRGLAAGAAALPTAFFVGGAQAQTAPLSTIERVTNSKQLRMAVVSGSPPYFKKDLATGQWAGAAVEMAKSIAGIWGAEVVFVEMHIRQFRARRSVQQDRHRVCPQPDAAARSGYRLHPSLHCRAVRLPRAKPASSRKPGMISTSQTFGSPSTWDRCTRPVPAASLRRLSSPATRPSTNAFSHCNPGAPMPRSLPPRSASSTVGKNPTLGPYHCSAPLRFRCQLLWHPA